MSTISNSALFQRLPSTDEILRQSGLQALIEREGHTAVAESVRLVLARLRQEIAAGQLDEKSLDLALGGLSAAVARQLEESLSYSLRLLINATGVILHTNLGRAPLASTVFDHIRETAAAYSNLEFELESGERGKRDVHVERLFQKLIAEEMQQSFTPVGQVEDPTHSSSAAISTIVVNNNAAAVLLALNSLAEGGEVIVSRGELVEIGGSFAFQT